MEWAYELVTGYRRRRRPRAQPGWSSTRTIVVPIVNPDGFNVSREAGELYMHGDGAGTTGRQRRDRRRRVHPRRRHPPERVPAQELPPARRASGRQLPAAEHRHLRAGVDPNRNYGAFWGGPGAERRPARRDLPRARPVLRARDAEHPRARLEPPGDHADHEPHVLGPGAAPARPRVAGPRRRTSRRSRRSATRWRPRTATRASTAGSSTTPPARPRTGPTPPPAGSATRSRSATSGFHPPFAETVAEWNGTTDDATGGGNRAAYYKAQENTADAAKHSVLAGRAPGGRGAAAEEDVRDADVRRARRSPTRSTPP